MKHSSVLKIALIPIIMCEVGLILTYKVIYELIGIIIMGISIIFLVWFINHKIKLENKGEPLLEKKKFFLQLSLILGLVLLIAVVILNLNVIYSVLIIVGLIFIAIPIFHYLHRLK